MEPIMGWTSVQDNLPEQKVKVLTFDKSHFAYDVAYFTIRGKTPYWLSKEGQWSILVTHWMPLPPPPTKDDK